MSHSSYLIHFNLFQIFYSKKTTDYICCFRLDEILQDTQSNLLLKAALTINEVHVAKSFMFLGTENFRGQRLTTPQSNLFPHSAVLIVNMFFELSGQDLQFYSMTIVSSPYAPPLTACIYIFNKSFLGIGVCYEFYLFDQKVSLVHCEQAKFSQTYLMLDVI